MTSLASLLLAVAVVAASCTLQLARGAGQCEVETDCATLENSICSEGQCICPPGYIGNDDFSRCLRPSVESGYECELASQCGSRIGQNVVCEDSVCRCGPGTHYLHGACYQTAGLGEACKSSDECFDNYATHTLTCASGVCACADGAYERYGVCRLKARGAGDACDYNEDCSETDASLSCVEHVCTASTAATFEASVMVSTQVESQRNYRSIRSTFASSTTCASDTDCDAAETCSAIKTCACKRGYFRDTDGVCKLELGQTCAADGDCSHIANARCGEADSARGPTCHCGPRWAPDAFNNFCRLARKMNYSCAVGANCFSFGNGICNDYKCACDDGFRYVEERNFCWPIKAPGDTCTETLDCYYNGSSCTEGVCVCAKGYHIRDGTCVKDIKALGDECVAEVDCTSVINNSTCSNGQCSCDDKTVQTAPTVCSVGVKGKCSVNEICSAVSGALCIDGECNCVEGYTVSAAKDTCIEVATEVGGPCNETAQCEPLMGDYSTCNMTTRSCACVAGMHFADGACWNITVLGQQCARSSDCFVVGTRDGVECRNSYCHCKFGYVTADDSNACISGATSGMRLGASTSALLLLVLSFLRSPLC